MLNVIHWNLDPAIFSIFGRELRYYGLMFVFSFISGYLIIKKYYKFDGLQESLLDKLLVYIFLGTLIGARLGHCLFYQSSYYLSNPIAILYVWKGGLASHGAFIGIAIALWIYARRINLPLLWIIDRVVIAAALAGFFIRMGNFFNSEIYGIETNLPWGVIFHRAGLTKPVHPTQIYEALSYLCIFIGLHLHFLKIRKNNINGRIFGLFLVILFSVRFIIEFIKADQVNFEKGMALNMGQWLSIPLILAGFYFLYKSKKTHKKPSSSETKR